MGVWWVLFRLVGGGSVSVCGKHFYKQMLKGTSDCLPPLCRIDAVVYTALVTHYILRALKWKTNALVHQGRLIYSRFRPNASANEQFLNKQNKTKVAGGSGISFNECRALYTVKGEHMRVLRRAQHEI